MRVLEESTSRLKLQHRPFGHWIGGGLLVLGSVGWLIYVGGFKPWMATLRCDRPTPTQTNCILTQKAIFRPVQQLRLFDPQNAELITKRGSKGSRHYELSITSLNQETTLLPGSSQNYDETVALVNHLNQYIRNSAQKTVILQANALGSTLFLSALALVALVLGIHLTRSPVVTCCFYKRIDQVRLERKRWNRSLQVETHRLGDILTAELEEKQVKNGKVYRAVLVLASAERLPLTQDFTSETNARKMVYWVQKFLATR